MHTQHQPSIQHSIHKPTLVSSGASGGASTLKAIIITIPGQVYAYEVERESAATKQRREGRPWTSTLARVASTVRVRCAAVFDSMCRDVCSHSDSCIPGKIPVSYQLGKEVVIRGKEIAVRVTLGCELRL